MINMTGSSSDNGSEDRTRWCSTVYMCFCVGSIEYLPLVAFELLPDGTWKTSCGKIRGKDSPGRRNTSKDLKMGGGVGCWFVRGMERKPEFWSTVSPRERSKISGFLIVRSRITYFLEGHTKELILFLVHWRVLTRGVEKIWFRFFKIQ